MPNNDSFGSSEIMFPAVTTAGGPGHAMMQASPLATPAMAAAVGMGHQGPAILHGSLNQTWLLNCLRRRWVMATLLGTLFAAVTGVLLLLLFPRSSTVTALVHVQEENTDLMEKKKALLPQQLEVFQDTQVSMLKSQFVLMAALGKRSIAELEAVKKKEPDPVAWLQEELRVLFQGENLQLSFTGKEDAEEMKKVIDAVIEAYQTEVLVVGRSRSKGMRNSMAKMHKKLTTELEQEIEKYATLADELGGSESPVSAAMLNLLAREVQQIQFQIMKKNDLLVEFAINRRLAEQEIRSTAALEQQVAFELDKDPMLANYKAEEFSIMQQIRAQASRSKHKNSPAIKRLQQGLVALQQESAQYRRQAEASIREAVKNTPSELMNRITMEYVLRRNNLSQELVALEAKLESKQSEMLQKGERSSALAMMDSNIEQLKEIDNEMEYQLRTWGIKDGASSDELFHVLQQASAREHINTLQRIILAALGGIAAFCVTCYGVALIEFRSRRLNNATDMDEGLGLRVLGVLPAVSSRKAMAPGSMVAAQLSESIDNVRATLMHDSTTSKRQVILVTSPATMEGTTTVASHLALSLTRAGRRTLLIDGDIREPALHKLFGMPQDDGLCEVLRSEIDVADAVRPTNTEGLWLLAAGHCDMDAIHALATDQPQPIFQKLREDFDFIIIDGAPVLGLSDSISIGQHVDGAILSVLRDHSEVRQVHQAIELLKSMGIRLLGSVVNGVPLKADRRIVKLYKENAQQPRKIAAAAGKSKRKSAQASSQASEKTVSTEEDITVDLNEELDIDFDDFGIDGNQDDDNQG